jgi:hypothetical protein
MSHKSEVISILLPFHSYVATQHRLPILAFQTDNGNEFDNFTLRSSFTEHGIHLRLSCPYTSPQNGKAERILHMLNDYVCTMLMQPHAPTTFWVEALNTTTYLLNHRPCRATGTTTSFELLLGVPLMFDHLRIFRCLCFPNMMATADNKLSARSAPCVFLGYTVDHKGYKCSNLATCKLITSRHIVFDETQFSFVATLVQQTPMTRSSTPRPVTLSSVDDGLPPLWWLHTNTMSHHAGAQTRASMSTSDRGPSSRQPSAAVRHASAHHASRVATPLASTSTPAMGTSSTPRAMPTLRSDLSHVPASSTAGDVIPPRTDPSPGSTSPLAGDAVSAPTMAPAPAHATKSSPSPHHMVTRSKIGSLVLNKKYAMMAAALSRCRSPCTPPLPIPTGERQCN